MNPTDDSTLQPAMHPALELLQSGGPVVAILLVLSVAALAIVLAKLWQFRRLGDALLLISLMDIFILRNYFIDLNIIIF